MPFYDFRCRSCGASFERRLSMSAYEAGEGRACPECDARDEVERVFTPVNVGTGAGRASADACCRAPSGFT